MSFRSIQHQLLQPARGLRYYTQSLSGIAPTVAKDSSVPQHALQKARPAYFVPRNTRGSIPVYTDQINTKYMTLVRNVEGNVSVSRPQTLPSGLYSPSYGYDDH